ncbi:trk system potassium uptake protein TrkA [Marinobacter daqiaonensis]|uniref:Trk system potassium uptake protein TrkA n=1 Tax=Marinobacter daqiaonensis TaxID=650891 RepID=A0A1I6I5N2_9GAMM|nr:TrkA family potassium uptake protein [Marinobacter daqiaonensis]SFR62057.1 trk system potassium uptake protein TrkA [Marinobacter daqiaonensis]
MIEKQEILVIGLGVFGSTIASELSRLGHNVLGVDNDEHRVDRLADQVTHAVIIDVSDDDALEEVDAGSYDVAVVAMGQDFEATVLATMRLKELGVPKVWAKAVTTQHHRILERLGADRVIDPDYEMGERVAQELNYPMVEDYLDLGGEEFVVELHATDELVDRSLEDVIGSTEVHALMIRRGGQSLVHPQSSLTIEAEDKLILAGQLEALRELARDL